MAAKFLFFVLLALNWIVIAYGGFHLGYERGLGRAVEEGDLECLQVRWECAKERVERNREMLEMASEAVECQTRLLRNLGLHDQGHVVEKQQRK